MKTQILLGFLIVILLASCGKKKICDHYEAPAPPPAVLLELQRAGINIPRDTVREIKCYWYKMGIKTYLDYNVNGYTKVTYLEYYDEFLQKQVVDSFRPLLNIYAITVAQAGSNMYYIEFPDSKLDSVVVDGQVSYQTYENNCVGTIYGYKPVLYHGATAPIDSQMRKKNIYLTAYICDKPN